MLQKALEEECDQTAPRKKECVRNVASMFQVQLEENRNGSTRPSRTCGL